MSWNYRIVRRKVGDEQHFSVHEVYYDAKGNVEAISESASEPYGETLDELANDLRYFSEALEKPVLDYDTQRIMYEP